LRANDDISGAGCAGQVVARFKPLVSQWVGTVCRDGEREIGADEQSSAGRLRRDGGGKKITLTLAIELVTLPNALVTVTE